MACYQLCVNIIIIICIIIKFVQSLQNWVFIKLSFMKINYVKNTEIALFGNTMYIGKMQEQD